jgi:hypothetical protein
VPSFYREILGMEEIRVELKGKVSISVFCRKGFITLEVRFGIRLSKTTLSDEGVDAI